MKLPKVNIRKQESREHQFTLYGKIRETIANYQNETKYEFETYEIDNVLLEMIKRHHEGYLNVKFGTDAI